MASPTVMSWEGGWSPTSHLPGAGGVVRGRCQPDAPAAGAVWLVVLGLCKHGCLQPR